MPSIFDEVVDRRNTNSLKYDFARIMGKPEGLLPMWVADMDFRTAPEILEALHTAVSHGIFGYSGVQEAYFRPLHDWYAARFGWETRQEWVVHTPGVVFALNKAIQAFTEPGDGVMIQRPVYYPFFQSIRRNGRRVINSPLRMVEETAERPNPYRMDLATVETLIRQEKVKLFILCSPHNPVGRVWTEEELLQLGGICLQHGVIVVSDEIHADFVFPGHRHHVFAGLKPEFAEISVTCTAPSKTFNLAGLQTSNIFIPNAMLRKAYVKTLHCDGLDDVNLLGLVACQAAYTHGTGWLEKLKVYLAENIRFVREYLTKNLPEIHMIEPEGTYLPWLDCRGTGLNAEEQDAAILGKGKLWLDAGVLFGPEGAGFQRLNVACPRSTLEQGMDALRRAFK